MTAAPGLSGWRPTASCSLAREKLQVSVLVWTCVENHGQDRRIPDKAAYRG